MLYNTHRDIMTFFSELTREQKVLANRIFTASIQAVAPNDPTGHLPNCGYSDEAPKCDCLDMGHRLMQAIIDELATSSLPTSEKGRQ